MSRSLTFSIIFVLLFSCKENNISSLPHSITMADILVMDVPDKIRFSEGKGIDSYVAYLINDRRDTMHIEYGSKGVIYSFRNNSPAIFSLSQKETVLKASGKEPSKEEVVFSEYPEEDKEQNIFDKNYFLYDTVAGITMKIIQPKRIGDGITGLYIPKLKDNNSFSIYGVNLDSSAHIEMIRLFKTIRYK